MAAKPFESRIQDLVYNVDVGIGLRLIKGGLYFLVRLHRHAAVHRHAVPRTQGSPRRWTTPSSAATWPCRDSLVTQCVRPVSMWYLIEAQREARSDDQPSSGHPASAALAGAAGAEFKVTGVSFDFNRATGPIPPSSG